MIAVLFRAGIVQGRKFEFEEIAAPIQLNRLRPFRRRGQGHFLVALFERGQIDRRLERIFRQVFRIKAIRATDAAEPHFAVAGFEFALKKQVALQAVIRRKQRDFLGLQVQAHKAARARHPQIAVVILHHRINGGHRKTVGGQVILEFPGLLVEFGQTVLRR